MVASGGPKLPRPTLMETESVSECLLEVTFQCRRKIPCPASGTPSSSSLRAENPFRVATQRSKAAAHPKTSKVWASKPRFLSSASHCEASRGRPSCAWHTWFSQPSLLGREVPDASPQLTVCSSGKRLYSFYPRKCVRAASLPIPASGLVSGLC